MNSDEIWGQFISVAALPDDEIELGSTALLIARAEYPQLDGSHQLGLIDSLAKAVSRRLGNEDDPLFCINTLSQCLFDEFGFRGNPEEYYDPRNSFLNEVLRRRLGIPITLSVVYIEVAKRLGVPLVGVGMPGHFLIRHRDVEELFIDPFYGGILLSVKECSQRLQEVTRSSVSWDPQYLSPVSNREFIARILRNLKGIYLRSEDPSRALRTMNWLVALQPLVLQERRDRGLAHYQIGNYEKALEDLEAYLDSAPHSPDTEVVKNIIGRLAHILGN